MKNKNEKKPNKITNNNKIYNFIKHNYKYTIAHAAI